MSRFDWLFQVLPFAMVILGGCTTPVTSLEKVHAGMTKEEVIRTLGEPYGRELRNGIEISISLLSKIIVSWTG
jgi:outer membrane protein assembly factor BamE (lipoprotein component of BamABCDE complex)